MLNKPSGFVVIIPPIIVMLSSYTIVDPLPELWYSAHDDASYRVGTPQYRFH
jgi:hypothetical protein